MGIEFSVSPKDFVPNTSILLNATVLDLRYNNTRYTPSCNVDFFEVNPNGGETKLGTNDTSNGVALWRLDYPSGTVARAYKAIIVSAEGTPQNIASSPVQLTVGTATRLLLNATRDFNSTRHVFNAKLLSGSSGVSSKTIKLKLNQTEYSNTTDANGLAQFVLWLSPQADNSQTNYNVVASFGGDSTLVAKARFTLPNGTQYDVCTTIQYDSFKPSANSTSITVRPQTTDGATTLMNQEQMQKDADIRIWHEFSWLPPWYKLHIDAQATSKLFYYLDLFGSGNLVFEEMQNPSNIDMGVASNGALTEASIVTAISIMILLSPEKILATLIGGASLFIGTMVAIGIAYMYSGGDFISFLWGMLTVLYITLYATLQYAYQRVVFLLGKWLNLWQTFSQSPVVATLIASLVATASLATLLIWPPPLRGILSVPIVLSIIAIWILIALT